MISYGREKYPNEFGGLLLGRYSHSNRRVEIKDFILCKSYKSSRYFFERGIEGLKEQLLKHYNSIPSLIYVGEWHTHPDNPPIPSQTDLSAMRMLVANKNVLITNPVLIIFGISSRLASLKIYLFYDNNLIEYEEK